MSANPPILLCGSIVPKTLLGRCSRPLSPPTSSSSYALKTSPFLFLQIYLAESFESWDSPSRTLCLSSMTTLFGVRHSVPEYWSSLLLDPFKMSHPLSLVLYSPDSLETSAARSRIGYLSKAHARFPVRWLVMPPFSSSPSPFLER
jgi:hypothetical protein